MKFATILLSWLMVHTSWASAQTRQSVTGSTAAAPSAEEEIENLEEMRNHAVLRGDVAALERMTSDDYTFITLRGEMRTKAEILRGLRLVVSLVEPVGRSEDYPESRIRNYRFQHWNGASWITLTGGETPAPTTIHRIPRVSSQRVRLLLESSRNMPHVAEIGVYNEPA